MSGEQTTRRPRFTVDHPFLTVLLLSICMVLFEFTVMFPPLIFIPEKQLERLAYQLAPLLWGVGCLLVVVRSAFWKMPR